MVFSEHIYRTRKIVYKIVLLTYLRLDLYRYDTEGTGQVDRAYVFGSRQQRPDR